MFLGLNSGSAVWDMELVEQASGLNWGAWVWVLRGHVDFCILVLEQASHFHYSQVSGSASRMSDKSTCRDRIPWMLS